jgi:hypothetical protein
MSLPVLEILEFIEITLACLENIENEFICFRTCRKYIFRKFRKLIYLIYKL